MHVKKYAGLLFIVFFILCACLFPTGCGETEGDMQVTNLQIDKNGAVISNIVEDFDKEFYSVETLREMMQEEIDGYNASHPEAVLLKSAELSGEEEEKVQVSMQYASCEDYMTFNDTELFYGTVEQAQAAGFSLDVEMVSVSDGAKKISEADILEMKDMHLLIVRQSAQVSQISVPEKVQYMTEGCGVTGGRTITLPGPENADEINWKGELTYILMK